MLDLHQKFRDQENVILALIKSDFQSCSGITCYLQTAIRKAPDFYTFLTTHFRPVPEYAKNGTWSCPWTSGKSGEEVPLKEHAEPGHGAEGSSHPPFSFGDDGGHPDFSPSRPPPPPPSPEDIPPQFGTLEDKPVPPPPPPSEAEPFQFGGSDTSTPPPSHPGHPNSASDQLEHPPWKPNHGYPNHRPHHPFRWPHHGRHHNYKLKIVLATTALVITLVIFIILFKSIRIYLSNPRVQADRAARREECRNRREYRRAACQHRIRQCFSRLRGRRRSRSPGTDDYEEKRAMLLRRNSETQISSHILGADIISLRRAHEIVGRLMRAEEGRIQNNPSAPSSTISEVQPIASSSRSIRSLQTTTTLPPYAPPPRYSQELSRDMEVVDGFRYTPSTEATEVASSASSFILNDDDLCTESSVVDCRSRMSMDTDSVAPSFTDRTRSKKSLELAGDRFRGQFD